MPQSGPRWDEDWVTRGVCCGKPVTCLPHKRFMIDATELGRITRTRTNGSSNNRYVAALVTRRLRHWYDTELGAMHAVQAAVAALNAHEFAAVVALGGEKPDTSVGG